MHDGFFDYQTLMDLILKHKLGKKLKSLAVRRKEFCLCSITKLMSCCDIWPI